MASRTTVRVLGFLIFAACVAVVAFGVWYVRGGASDDDDVALDDDLDPGALKPDGGAHAHGGKKRGHRTIKGKRSSGARHASAVAPPAGPIGPSGPSYESAVAGNDLQLTMGANDAPDLTDAQLAGPMRNGTFLDVCGVPTSTHVTVKVAIRNGRAVGVSVYASPPSAPLSYCVERQVRGLAWPSSAKMDSFVTNY